MSNNNFDFDFDDVSTDNMAKGVKVAIFVLFFVMSAVTTFQFFFNYAPGLGAFAGPDVGPYLSGVMGVLLLDAASLVWLYVRSSLCTTQTQMNMALVAAITTITGALLTSSVYVLLTSQLDVGVTSVNGQMTDFGMALNVVGNTIMIAALIINFGGMFLFEAKDIKIQQAIGRTTLLAQDKHQKLRIALQRQFLTAQAETSRIKDKLPTVAHTLGTEQADRYIDALQSGSHRVPQQLPVGQPMRAPQGNGKYRTVRISLLGKIIYGQSIHPSLAEAYENLDFSHPTDAGGFVIDAVTGLPADDASQKAADHFGWEPQKHGFPQQGNGVTRRVNPINIGEDVTPAGPQRMASESPNELRPELRRANQPGE